MCKTEEAAIVNKLQYNELQQMNNFLSYSGINNQVFMHYVYNNIYILFKCDIIINIYGCFIRSVLVTDAETIIHI